jgi:cytochrome c5
LKAVISLLAFVCAITAAGAAGITEPLKEGDGKDIVSVACAQCHSTTAITHLRLGEDAWRRYVYDMVARGAQLSPAETDKVVSYLATNYGPGIDLPASTRTRTVQLPEGPGKDLVEANCTVCHDIFRAVGTSRNKEQWETVVNKMVDYGSPLSGAEKEALISYLGSNFGDTSPARGSRAAKKP